MESGAIRKVRVVEHRGGRICVGYIKCLKEDRLYRSKAMQHISGIEGSIWDEVWRGGHLFDDCCSAHNSHINE